MVVLPWWPTRLQISSDAQGFSSLHRLFILIFYSEDSYAWLRNMLKYHVHFLHVLDLPAADIIRQYTNLQKGFIHLIYV